MLIFITREQKEVYTLHYGTFPSTKKKKKRTTLLFNATMAFRQKMWHSLDCPGIWSLSVMPIRIKYVQVKEEHRGDSFILCAFPSLVLSSFWVLCFSCQRSDFPSRVISSIHRVKRDVCPVWDEMDKTCQTWHQVSRGMGFISFLYPTKATCICTFS